MTITQKGRQLAHDLGLSGTGEDARICSLLMRHATTLQRLAVEECNGPGDWINRIPYPRAGEIMEKWQADLERKQESLELRVKELATQLPNVKGVHVSGDPRGTVVKLIRVDGKHNTWGGAESGWAVPAGSF